MMDTCTRADALQRGVGSASTGMDASCLDELQGMLTSRLLPLLHLADLQALTQASQSTRGLVQV